MLITFEGIDGCGKSTLVTKLQSLFPNTAITTKEPGSPHTSLGADLRALALNNRDLSSFERELIFYVDASQHRTFIERNDDCLILSDRGYWSHLAYLYGCLKTKKMDYEQYVLCKKVIEQVCAKPTAVVYIDGDLNLMRERISNKEKDAIESNNSEYFAYVLSHYDDLLAARRDVLKLPTLTLNGRDSIDKNLAICHSFITEAVKYGFHPERIS